MFENFFSNHTQNVLTSYLITELLSLMNDLSTYTICFVNYSVFLINWRNYETARSHPRLELVKVEIWQQQGFTRKINKRCKNGCEEKHCPLISTMFWLIIIESLKSLFHSCIAYYSKQSYTQVEHITLHSVGIRVKRFVLFLKNSARWYRFSSQH